MTTPHVSNRLAGRLATVCVLAAILPRALALTLAPVSDADHVNMADAVVVANPIRSPVRR